MTGSSLDPTRFPRSDRGDPFRHPEPLDRSGAGMLWARVVRVHRGEIDLLVRARGQGVPHHGDALRGRSGAARLREAVRLRGVAAPTTRSSPSRSVSAGSGLSGTTPICRPGDRRARRSGAFLQRRADGGHRARGRGPLREDHRLRGNRDEHGRRNGGCHPRLLRGRRGDTIYGPVGVDDAAGAGEGSVDLTGYGISLGVHVSF